MTPELPPLTLIAAVARNGVIGTDNALPWHLPDDLRHFRAQTLDRPVLMGRRTWESLGRPLPRRRHLVLSRQGGLQADGIEVYASLQEAWQAAAGAERLMVIGGAAVYALTLPLASRLLLTCVDADVAGDALFPPVDPALWHCVAEEYRPADAEHRHARRFTEWQRHPAAGPAGEDAR